MSDVYKLQYNGMTLAYPGWNGYVGYEPEDTPYQRYEYTLFEAPDGLGVSAGTVSMPYTAFDEIGICLGWKDTRNLHGVNYNWMPSTTFSATSASTVLNYAFSNNSTYYVISTRFNFSNADKTFVTDKNGLTANMYGGMQTPTGNNTKFNAWNTDTKVITKIIGVKYQ